jgi:hypothetical protein
MAWRLERRDDKFTAKMGEVRSGEVLGASYR